VSHGNLVTVAQVTAVLLARVTVNQGLTRFALDVTAPEELALTPLDEFQGLQEHNQHHITRADCEMNLL